MKYYVGVDGGGTRTRCLVCDEQGHILGSGLAGPSNHHIVGKDGATTALRESIYGALSSSGYADPLVVYLGLAGVAQGSDRMVIESIVASLSLNISTLTVDSDATVALAGALLGEPGVVVISGTGSIVYGINRNGQHARAGGWGPILGDEGSGYDMGRKAMIAALKSHDGRGKSTKLTSLLLTVLGLAHLTELVNAVYSSTNIMTRDRVADLAKVVFAAASEGDLVAQEIISCAGRELAQGVSAVIRKLGLCGDSIPVALSGGLFSATDVLQNVMVAEVGRLAPKARIVKPASSPEVGALLLALQSSGKIIDESILNNIISFSEGRWGK